MSNSLPRWFGVLVLLFVFGFTAQASSHREAPLIADDPLADNTDVYAFRSPDDPSTITLIANYIPMELPQGGPNYYTFGENIRYEIHVDNDAASPGDEVTYRLTFARVNQDPTTFFNIRLGAQNIRATYVLQRSLDGGATFETILEEGIVPANNIGPRSIESGVGLDSTYQAVWENAIATATTGETVFAGPADDPFFVDLGGIFDLGDSPRQDGPSRAQSGYMQLSSKLRLEDPTAIEPRITIAKIFINEARVTGEHGHYYPAALKLLNEALALNHQGTRDKGLEFDALATKASVELSQHDFAKALVSADQAVLINPYNSQVYGAVVDANVELGNYTVAVTAGDKMISIRPDLRSYSRISYLREIHGDADGAIEAMKLAVNAGYPGYESTAWARLTLGELYQRYGKPLDAEMQFKQILKDRPNYPFAIAALGELALEKKDYSEAEKHFNEAKNIIPEVGYYINLAKVYQATNRNEEFKAIEKEIFTMLQDDVDSGHNMDLEYATLYRDLLKDYDKALEYTMQEYQRRPKNIDVNRLLASIFVKKGDIEAARKHLAVAASTDSRHPELLELQGLAK